MHRMPIGKLALIVGLGLGCRSTSSDTIPPSAAGPAATDLTAIEGMTWRLVELAGRPIAPGATNVPPTIRLDPETGLVLGSTGCNRLRGSYTLEGGKLTFGPILSTLMACAKGMEVETALSELFSKVDGYELSGRNLTLTSGGIALARFEAPGA